MQITRRLFLLGTGLAGTGLLAADLPQGPANPGRAAEGNEWTTLLMEQGYLTQGSRVVIPPAALADAVTAFQKANELQITGRINQETLTRLRERPATRPLRSGPAHWELTLAPTLLRFIDGSNVKLTLNTAMFGLHPQSGRPVIPRGAYWIRQRQEAFRIFGDIGLRAVPAVTAASPTERSIALNERELSACIARGLLIDGQSFTVA